MNSSNTGVALLTILDFLPSITSHIVRIKLSAAGSVKNEESAFLTNTLIVCSENSARASDLLLEPSARILQTGQVGQVSAAWVSDRFAKVAIKFLSA